jgi:phosphoribosylanthranilate isomerase
MTRPFVKVCGITRAEDALAAVRAGARAIGFVFVPGSPRQIDVTLAASIARLLPPRIARVGVVCDLDREAMRDLIDGAGLTALQAHGEEPPELCAGLGVPVIKAFAAGPGFDPGRLAPYRPFPVLLDGGTRPGWGGSGQSADWAVARAAREQGFRVLLAGGLGPDNVALAVRRVEPIAIDLNSGVEQKPGEKDPERMAAALAALGDLEPPLESSWPW